jgi:hypothetical protein
VTLAQLPVRLPLGLSFTLEAGAGWSVSRCDIGLVSGRGGRVTRSSRSVAGGPWRAAQLPVRYVIVVTLTIFWARLAARKPGLFPTALESLNRSLRVPSGGPRNRHKEFFGAWV